MVINTCVKRAHCSDGLDQSHVKQAPQPPMQPKHSKDVLLLIFIIICIHIAFYRFIDQNPCTRSLGFNQHQPFLLHWEPGQLWTLALVDAFPLEVTPTTKSKSTTSIKCCYYNYKYKHLPVNSMILVYVSRALDTFSLVQPEYELWGNNMLPYQWDFELHKRP
jgi:hypothetical protein